MRTEEDLRNAFDHLADSAPDPSNILAAQEPKPVRRSRTPLVLGAVLATTAAVVAVPVIVNHNKQQTVQPATQPPTRPANDSWRDRLNFPQPANLPYFDSSAFGRHSQGVILTSETSTCVVNAYAKGAFDAGSIPPGSQRIKINGTLGYVAVLADPFSPQAPKVKWAVWEPAPNTWMTTYCQRSHKVDPAGAVALAKVADLSEQRLPAPYRIGYVPAGLNVTSLSVIPHSSATSEAEQDFIAYLGTDQDEAENPSTGQLPHAQITYLTADSATATHLPKNAEQLTINGRTAYLGTDEGPNVLAIKGEGFQVRIELGGTVPNERGELIKIAKGMDLTANPHDLRAWFDAAVAIP
ncbi:hypothetical protein F1D05_34710 [Kribbella qitaiheensis]|uniref:Uncharacterized protein n=1 Tax=Kribbella qitaiheensis TaxID=1544730 RepID=A0A7G6X7A5_9ACTN|nr:hypothetical protein [Kribbella qitaiheensis]QNE22120.1 hypothetical protein F1D05_34710 [Kribbella qitaiheensis]